MPVILFVQSPYLKKALEVFCICQQKHITSGKEVFVARRSLEVKRNDGEFSSDRLPIN